ncbi:MAG: isoleucine--tRNA ligase [Pirellulales bacterium]|nr:isoleucine--tRNA ligase [Pirellulales bacterium]
MFPITDKNEGFSSRELAVGAFWKERGIYEKTLDARAGAPNFVFYEGPPTANGMPHPGHCLTRAIKDLFPRYRTMRGYRCERKAGWDTHGLPVEVEVCKELGIHSKEEIEAYGVEPFIRKCQQSVWRYMQEWERLTERIGFWVDIKDAYATYHQSYVESVWWSLKTLFDRGELYQGHKIVWWWAQGGTALSAGEVSQGYREVADPSVFVKFPLLNANGSETDTSLLVWTTTPWTLPSNQFVAVSPDLEYAVVVDPQEDTGRQKLIIASALVETIAAKVKRELTVESTVLGRALVGKRYRPPFDCFYQQTGATGELLDPDTKELGQRCGKLQGTDTTEHLGWRIVSADFVTTDSGSGIVHQAPAFGEVDYEVLMSERERFEPGFQPALINCVGPDGKFTDEGPEFVRGRWVKDCDKDINRDLKERGLLYHQEQYRHDYPFCWRAEQDPLIQYPRESWFIRTTDAKDQMLANNQAIQWLPGHIQEGRFGKFLESNVDWALSRERYWGTPLPIWVCEQTGRQEAVGSYDELLGKPGLSGTEVWDAAKQAHPELPDDLQVHKPYIDSVTYDSPFAQGARMQRVTEVIDCWYDSGAMPFAQWGYQGELSGPKRERFESQFPADFISEAVDQTRGWFYSQLAISTMMFGNNARTAGDKAEVQREENGGVELEAQNSPYPHPFRNCIVLGLMLGEDGQKMSKSKRNYRDPSEIFDLYGADALRWYFFANQPPWTSIRYSEQAIKDSIPEFLLRLWNVYSFFSIYANIDDFRPNGDGGSRSENRRLDADTFARASSYRPVQKRGELDRWICSELGATSATVVERMDAYDNYAACQAITTFVDALSNWYVRRSRDRFWASDKQSPQKLDAYWTLYECLLTTTRLVAPFVPFLADSLWQNLAVSQFGDAAEESVHLCDYPEPCLEAVDEALSAQMNLVREISSLGRQARSSAELKVRQPLAKVEVILADSTHQAWLESHAGLIADELNVKEVEFTNNAEQYIDYLLLPNFKLLGPKLGKNMPLVKKRLAETSGGPLLAELKSTGQAVLEINNGKSIVLGESDIEVRLQAKPGWTAAQGRGVVVVLSTQLTPELLAEGLIRDLVRAIQDLRKDRGCEFTDRIECSIVTESAELQAAIESFLDYLMGETLAVAISLGPLDGVEPVAVSVGGHEAHVYLRVAP